VSSIIEARNDLNIYGAWNKNYLPFAKDLDDNYLIINNGKKYIFCKFPYTIYTNIISFNNY
jgi:hypothetical protein